MTLESVRAKGGFLIHLKPRGKHESLCGHKPASPSTSLMKRRSGWIRNPTICGCRPCEKCFAKARDIGESRDKGRVRD
jgi:hypothetical protein